MVEYSEKLGYLINLLVSWQKSAIFSYKFSEYLGNSSHSNHSFNKSSILARENPQKIGISHITQYLFTNFCIYMWVYQVKNVKLQATAKLFIVAIFYQTNPIQNTTNITEITKYLLNSVPCTNLKIGEVLTNCCHCNSAQSDTSHTLLLLSQISHRH